MIAVRGYSGNAVCVTTRGTSPDANLSDELRGLTDEELRAETKRVIAQMTDEECAELLEFARELERRSLT